MIFLFFVNHNQFFFKGDLEKAWLVEKAYRSGTCAVIISSVTPRFNPDWMVPGGRGSGSAGSPDCRLRALTPTGRSLPRGCKQQHPTREAPRKQAPDCGPRAHHPPSAQEQLCGVTNSLNAGPEWYPIPGENSTKKRQQSSRCPRAN